MWRRAATPQRDTWNACSTAASPATGAAEATALVSSRSAASQHLRILRDTGLVRVRVDANRRLYRVDVERIGQLRAFLDAFWGDRLDALKSTAERLDHSPGGRLGTA